MKENTRRNIELAGLYFGATAYRYTHMPVIVVRELRKGIGAYKVVRKAMREERKS